MRPIFRLIAACAGAMSVCLPLAARAAPAPIRPRPDVADTVAGTYGGAVISDAKGSSRDDVTVTVQKSGKNTVTITSDYPRLPVVTVVLTSAVGTVVQQSGNVAFFYDPSKSPAKLDIGFGDVSWSGTKQ